MLRRVALSLFFLAVLGVAAIFAAGHLGIELPWSIATTDHESSSKNREDASADSSKTTETSPGKAVEETTAALGGAPQASPSSGDVDIDISRISPDGTSVFAGRAAPDSYVTVLEDGKPAGTVKADSNGEWSLSTEHKFASTDPKLSYQVSQTPPPSPEPPKTKVAKAEPASPSPSAVAGEVMRKFENLVEQAREDAKKEEADKKQAAEKGETAAETGKPSQTGQAPSAPSQSVAAAESSSPQAAAPASPPPAAAATAPTVTVQETPPAAAPSAGVKTDIIPVPLMFVYNEATLTQDGERAAALLLEYLTLKRLSHVELTGHADERGTDDYNLDLSRERLDTVARLLKDGGYTGELKLTPKGKREPYMGVDRAAYSGEALYQLDRRVELRVNR